MNFSSEEAVETVWTKHQRASDPGGIHYFGFTSYLPHYSTIWLSINEAYFTTIKRQVKSKKLWLLLKTFRLLLYVGFNITYVTALCNIYAWIFFYFPSVLNRHRMILWIFSKGINIQIFPPDCKQSRKFLLVKLSIEVFRQHKVCNAV